MAFFDTLMEMAFPGYGENVMRENVRSLAERVNSGEIPMDQAYGKLAEITGDPAVLKYVAQQEAQRSALERLNSVLASQDIGQGPVGSVPWGQGQNSVQSAELGAPAPQQPQKSSLRRLGELTLALEQAGISPSAAGAIIKSTLPEQPNVDLLRLNETIRHNKAIEGQKLGKITGYTSEGEPIYADTSKPMPASAVKMQDEHIDAIATAGNIQKDLESVVKKLDEGKIKLGPIQNVESWARNKLGESNEVSRNYSTFKATLEKMRNDSLRLNKGVQTEGDAVRAWNEIFDNINDEDVVKQRLEEIQNINDRAMEQRKYQIDTIRSNYGKPEMDYSKLEKNRKPAILNKDNEGKQEPKSRKELILEEMKRRNL